MTTDIISNADNKHRTRTALSHENPQTLFVYNTEYTHLMNTVTEAQSSSTTLALQAEFCIPIANTLNREIPNSVISYHFSTSDIRKAWLATNLTMTNVAFGRLNATQSNEPQLILTHWILTTSFLDRPANIQI